MQRNGSTSAVWGIGTAVPKYRISQQQALAFMETYYRSDAVLKRRLASIYGRSHIDFRHSCADFSMPPADRNGGPDRFLLENPGTGTRMQEYASRVIPLVETAARQALARQTAFKASDVSHLITVTCTGFCAPGPDLVLMERLGLRRDVRRLQIGFMGCQAALQGLHTADAICRSDPQAVVLVVCAELCTLHFQNEPTNENLIVNSLFADGAAAAVVGSAGDGALCKLGRFASYVAPDTADQISWHIRDTGFEMGLSMATPKALRRALPGFLQMLMADGHVEKEGIDLWAVHSGGRAILDAVERSLELDPDDLRASRDVLRSHGNMSSPTVLFVMKRILEGAGKAPANGVALTFGPGLSLEGMLWRKDGRP